MKKKIGRAFLSSGEDWQVGMFLGATPLYYEPPADQSQIFPISSDVLLDHTTTDNRTNLVQNVTAVNARLLVNDAYGNAQFVTTDTQDGFTVLHTGTSSWSGSAWDRVSGLSSLNVNVGTPAVTVSGDVTISDYSKVVVCGLDSTTTPQAYAAIPNEFGNHGLPAQLFAPDALSGTQNVIISNLSNLGVAPDH